jgi:outer membrane protein TolC
VDATVAAPADVERIALERNPQVALAAAEVAREEAELARLRGERRPDFVLGGGYMLQPGGAGAWTARAGVTWPNAPWSRGALNTRIDAQEKRVVAAKARQDAVANDVKRSVQEAIVHLDAARERAHLLETAVVPQLDHAFEIARVAYASNRGDFADLLDTQRLLLATRMDVIAAQADVALAAADLELVLGGADMENQ